MTIIGCLFIGATVVLWNWMWMIQKKNINIVLQQNLMKEHYDALQQEIEQMRRMRHDLANHIHTMEQLVDEKDTQDKVFEIYKNALKDTYESLKKDNYCVDIVVNAVIKNKLQKAKEEGVTVTCNMQGFSIGKMDRVDMLGLLFNVFDNAIEACGRVTEGKRFIEISAQNVGDSLSLECVNSKRQGEILKNGQKTVKADKKNHGIGKDIIRNIVDKYKGSMQEQLNEKDYTLTVQCKW